VKDCELGQLAGEGGGTDGVTPLGDSLATSLAGQHWEPLRILPKDLRRFVHPIRARSRMAPVSLAGQGARPVRPACRGRLLLLKCSRRQRRDYRRQCRKPRRARSGLFPGGHITRACSLGWARLKRSAAIDETSEGASKWLGAAPAFSPAQLVRPVVFDTVVEQEIRLQVCGIEALETVLDRYV